MDLELMSATPTAREKSAVDGVLGPPSGRWDGGEREERDGQLARIGFHHARRRRHLLTPALHAVQKQIGWISKGAVNYICQRLSVAPAEAYGVASFYAWLAIEKRPPRVAHVCDDIVCRMAGAETLCAELNQTLGTSGWVRSPCLGLCERAPAAVLQLTGEDDRALAPASLETLSKSISGGTIASPKMISAPQTESPRDSNLRLLQRVGVADPQDIHDYQAHGGYLALQRAIALGPAGVIREVLDSKLVGRGGAAFPKGIKWEAVAQAPVRPHYVVANADESEPGTFKDRVLMEEDPFAVIESMTIAGYAVGAERGFLYIRAEYPLATARLEKAVHQARSLGLLGSNIMGKDFCFDIEIVRGAGAYICGEETALFNSIEGFRGEPRSKPPFPTEAGLFGKPTVVNNIETLVNALEIVAETGPAFAERGTPASTGHKLFCLAGCVNRPGLYEVELGATLRELIELAGGVRNGRALRAILLGGAAGSFVTPEHLDTPLTYEGVRAIGATLGSGAVVVIDDTVDLTDIVLRIAAFFRDESCGQCVPCRVGTVRQEEALQRLAGGRELESPDQEVALLREVAQVMEDASICGLGQTAAKAVISALKLGLLQQKESS